MTIDLDSVPPRPGGHTLADRAERDEVDALMTDALVELAARGAAGARQGQPRPLPRSRSGISAFCAFEVNRAGFLGPVAVRPDLMGRGAGVRPLVGALHELRRRGRNQHRRRVGWARSCRTRGSAGG